MKGQNLALESVATFGVTLVMAIGIVQIFGNVNDQVVESTKETQANVITDRLRTTVLQMSHMKGSERGYRRLDLPDRVGGQDYRLAIEEDKVILFTSNDNYQKKINIEGTSDVGGAVEGGEVRVFKDEQGFALREGR